VLYEGNHVLLQDSSDPSVIHNHTSFRNLREPNLAACLVAAPGVRPDKPPGGALTNRNKLLVSPPGVSFNNFVADWPAALY
jgi:hypothetical protein